MEEDPGEAPPLDRLRYPTGVALTPDDGNLPRRLLVVSSNFDLAFRSGVLHAYDLDELAGACGFDTPRLLTHLADLELRGLIRRIEGGRFMLC